MNISNLFQSLHGMLDEDALIHALDLPPEVMEAHDISSQEVEEIADDLGVDPNYFYYNPKGGMYPYCYWDGLLYFPFHDLQDSFLKAGDDPKFHEATRFKHQYNYLQDMVAEEDWEGILSFVDKKVTFLVFQSIQKHIPDNKKKELFLSIYARNEYGFDKLPSLEVRDILNLPTPKEYDVSLSEYQPDERNRYVVYRGVTSKSTPIEQAYSWTLSKETAHFFATRFNSRGHIYTGSVRKSDILAYLSERDEEEVLILPNDVEIISYDRV